MYYYVAGVTPEGRGIFEGPMSLDEAHNRLSDSRLIQAKVFESNHRDRGAAAAEYRASRSKAGENYDSILQRMKSKIDSSRRIDQSFDDNSSDEEDYF